MMNQYILTIAIPTYNREKLLKRSLESILQQNDNRVEILVSDTCSTDGTCSLMNYYATRYSNIRYIKNDENIGSNNNFLQCYRKARGKYIMLLGSDDLLLEGALKEIINFLYNNSVEWTFLNHTGFKGKFCNIDSCNEAFISDTGNFVTNDRMTFMKYAKYEVTFMSCQIIKKDIFNKVKNPEKYAITHFIHTNIAFEGTMDDSSNFGIITKCCIAQDQSPMNAGIETDIRNQFIIFGKWMKYTLCDVSSRYGYKYYDMYKIYIDRLCEYWPQMIITLKAENRLEWWNTFWEDAFPHIKKSIKTYIYILPSVMLPKKICKFIVKFIKPIYVKAKYRIKNEKKISSV